MLDQYIGLAHSLMRVKTTEQIIEDYEAFTEAHLAGEFALIIEWLKVELERRDKKAFDEWMSVHPELSPRRFFMK